MKNLSAPAIFFTVIAAGTMPAFDASAMDRETPHTAPRVATVAFDMDETDSRWFFWDGSQAMLGETAASVSPNIFAIVAGVTCNFRFVVRNGKRVKQEYCEQNR